MFVTNLTNVRLGIRGPLIMNPREKNLFIDDANTVVVEAVMRLKAANLVSVVKEAGITKSAPGKVVKTVKTTPKKAAVQAPKKETEKVVEKTIEEKLTEEKPVEEVKEPVETPVEKIDTVEDTKSQVEEVPPVDVAVPVDETTSKPSKKKKKK